MVRLKGRVELANVHVYWISIPYGAIKRADDEIRIYADYYISIPYGAIKSVWQNRTSSK